MNLANELRAIIRAYRLRGADAHIVRVVIALLDTGGKK